MDNTALENKLNALKIAGHVVGVTDNDFYTCYEVVFDSDITIRKIKSRCEDLTTFFGSGVDIETGAGSVIIKVKKASRDVVGLYAFTNELAAGLQGYEIPLAIGKTENGARLYYDLTKCPHILAAGATGSGKSVFMHNLIISTFYTGNVNLILIDVKRVELSIYEGIPHLAAPICYDARTALKTLDALTAVMMDRYETLKKAKCRNIKEYRDRGGKMNYITVFIDELADLVMNSRKIEAYLVRIAQLGRAAGIHLVLATQRPDASIISGLIRVNVPTRVCFAVQKSTDSRIILDMNGGEQLRGAGDGLFLPIGSRTPVKFQAPFISTQGIEKAADMARHVND